MSATSDPRDPLLCALINGDKQQALQLIASGHDVTCIDQRSLIGDGQTALHYAISYADESLIDQLVKHGADVNAQTVNGQTALWLACNSGCLSSIRALLENGADPNIRCHSGYSPMGRVKASDATIMELLKDFGAQL